VPQACCEAACAPARARAAGARGQASHGNVGVWVAASQPGGSPRGVGASCQSHGHCKPGIPQLAVSEEQELGPKGFTSTELLHDLLLITSPKMLQLIAGKGGKAQRRSSQQKICTVNAALLGKALQIFSIP